MEWCVQLRTLLILDASTPGKFVLCEKVPVRKGASLLYSEEKKVVLETFLEGRQECSPEDESSPHQSLV